MIAPYRIWPLAAALTVALGASTAHAQFGPQPQTPTQQPGQDKPEGVAEQAPKSPATLPTTPVLPPRQSERTKFELFELGGYFRLRTDWFKKFDQGFEDDPAQGGAPFPNPLGCAAAGGNCEDTLKSANIRLRLEPVISLRENSTQIFMQIDVLDNVVLGSTPNTLTGDGGLPPGNIPVNALADTQIAPSAGQNSRTDSLRVKRAWAEVETALGRIHFGRMPWDWGLGIYANGGGYDPIHGTYDILESDYGTTVDRVQFGRGIPGTNLAASIAMDWSSVFPVASQSDVFDNRYLGQPFDLDDNDDVNQWVFTILRRDTAKGFDDKVAKGLLAFNYGAFVAYKTQDFEQTNFTLGEAPAPENTVRRKAKAYIPNAWVRMAKGSFDFELEAVGIFGKIDDLSDQLDPDTANPITDEIDVRMFGAVARAGYRILDGDIRLGGEIGYASGDQWDSTVPGRTHARYARRFPGDGDTSMNAFFFNFDYEIDLILFRELLGTVSNTTYVRPTFDWKIGNSFRAKAQAVLSFVNVPVSTPGNGNIYGLEVDADFGYESGGFFAGIAYGVLFPFDALDHPESEGLGGPGFGYSEGNSGEASASQTIQTRLMLKF